MLVWWLMDKCNNDLQSFFVSGPCYWTTTTWRLSVWRQDHICFVLTPEHPCTGSVFLGLAQNVSLSDVTPGWPYMHLRAGAGSLQGYLSSHTSEGETGVPTSYLRASSKITKIKASRATGSLGCRPAQLSCGFLQVMRPSGFKDRGSRPCPLIGATAKGNGHIQSTTGLQQNRQLWVLTL